QSSGTAQVRLPGRHAGPDGGAPGGRRHPPDHRRIFRPHPRRRLSGRSRRPMSAALCFPMPPREAFFQTTIHSFGMYDNARLLPFFLLALYIPSECMQIHTVKMEVSTMTEHEFDRMVDQAADRFAQAVERAAGRFERAMEAGAGRLTDAWDGSALFRWIVCSAELLAGVGLLMAARHFASGGR